MAQTWYLMSSPYNQLSGFESEAIDDYGVEGFSEALLEIGVTVELYNADLSEHTEIKAIIQNRMQDTKLNDFRRHILTTIGTLKSGIYVKYKNNYWLIESIVDDNGIYEKAVMVFCNWKIAWLNADNDVVERYVYIQSASQYNNGQRESRYFVVQTDQLLIGMPDDVESVMIDVGKRFIIDKRVMYYEQTIPATVNVDTSFKLDVYKITRLDGVLYHYGSSGYHEIMVSQDEQDEKDGFYRVGKNTYWLCPDSGEPNQPPESSEQEEETPAIRYDIIGESYTILIGDGVYSYTSICYDVNDNVVNSESLTWDFDCDFIDKLQIDYIGNSINIEVDDSALFNKSFELLLYDNSEEVCRKRIKIKSIL